jgi:hypothetical protein
MFVISFALSLLALTAGLLLLGKAKQETGKFMKVMSWIIIGCGMLAIVLSVHCAIFKMVMHKDHDKDKLTYFDEKLPFQKFLMMKNLDDDDFPFAKDDDSDNLKVICKKETSETELNPEAETKAVVKVISDIVKLTPEQEKKIQEAIEKSLNTAKEVVPTEKETVKETK